jgi:hypothetical protein
MEKDKKRRVKRTVPFSIDLTSINILTKLMHYNEKTIVKLANERSQICMKNKSTVLFKKTHVRASNVFILHIIDMQFFVV